MTDLVDRNLQLRLVNALLMLPVSSTFGGRTSLLNGLPRIALNRSEVNARHDLSQVIAQFVVLGRDSRTGVRPLVVIAENGRYNLEDWQGDLSSTFREIIQELDTCYGGEVRVPELPPVEPERLLFKGRDERVPLAFFESALATSKSVARLKVPRIFDETAQPGDYVYGTGWLVAPGVLITNYHVIEARDRPLEPAATPRQFRLQAERAVVWFDYMREGGDSLECRTAELLSSDRNLDYAIVRLVGTEGVLSRYPLPIVREPPKLERGHRLNIVQHSGGGPMSFAIRNNFYVGIGDSDSFLRYLTDTQGGASGSPVLNDSWKVIALHHAATPIPAEYYVSLPQERYRTLPEEVANGEVITYHNEGISMHAILANLPSELCQQILCLESED